MTLPHLPGPVPNQDPDQEPEKIDMSATIERTANMLDPNLIIPYDQYMSPLTALGQREMIDISVALNRGKQPTILAFHNVPGRPGDVAAVPVLQRDSNTVDVHWSKQGKASLDLQRFLLHRQITIPNGHRAFVPMERDNLAKLGECLIFKFSSVTYAKIEPRGPRKQSSTSKKSTTAKAEGAKAPEKPEPSSPEAQ